MEALVNRERVALIGTGEMATRMALQLGKNRDYAVTEVRRDDDLAERLKDQDITVVTMRPQHWDEANVRTGKRAAEEIAEYANRAGLFTYIMAGIDIHRMREDLGEDIALVRAMPNIVVDGYSQTALYAEEGSLTAEQKAKVEAFYGQFGGFTWLESEAMFLPYTFYSASMLAFIADYVETHRQGAVATGFQEEQSEQMLAGALRAVAHRIDQGYTLRDIVQQVKTKRGITEAGVEASHRRSAIEKVTRGMFRAAGRRSRELAKR